MGSRSHPHRVLSVCVCVCVSRCLWVCVIEADSLQLRVITVGLYLFLSRSLLCQILAVFAVVVYGPFWFRDSWALLLPGLRSPDLGCPLLPCATRLSPTESSASAYGKLRFCLRKLRLCPTESSASAYGSSASALRKAPLLPTEAPPLPYGKLRLVSRCVLLPVINSLSATESSRLHCDSDLVVCDKPSKAKPLDKPRALLFFHIISTGQCGIAWQVHSRGSLFLHMSTDGGALSSSRTLEAGAECIAQG